MAILSRNLWYRRRVPSAKNRAASQLGSRAFTERHVCEISYRQFSPRAEREEEKVREEREILIK